MLRNTWHDNCVMFVPLHLQVRLQTNRNQDLRMNGGRAETDVEYDIGFDDSGKILALEIQVRSP